MTSLNHPQQIDLTHETICPMQFKNIGMLRTNGQLR